MILRRRRKAPRMGVRRSDKVRSQSHLAFVRGFACALFGKDEHTCSGKIEAAHVRTGTDGGTALKPSDEWTIPLCAGAHAEQHRIGESAFEAKWKIDMKRIAQQLWRVSPHRMKFEKQEGGNGR